MLQCFERLNFSLVRSSKVEMFVLSKFVVQRCGCVFEVLYKPSRHVAEAKNY